MLDRVPAGYGYVSDTVMTNYDHSIDGDVAEQIKKSGASAQYAAWNFCGHVWWNKDRNLWSCEIWQNGTHVNTLHADSLLELMDEACKLYGSK